MGLANSPFHHILILDSADMAIHHISQSPVLKIGEIDPIAKMLIVYAKFGQSLGVHILTYGLLTFFFFFFFLHWRFELTLTLTHSCFSSKNKNQTPMSLIS